MDAVYVVRKGDRNEELRYSLRATVAHLTPDRVWIAGYKPTWLQDVGYLPTKQGRARYENSRLNLLTACRSAEVSGRFVLLHDDYFILEPMDTVPVWHRGTIERVLGGRKPDTPYQRGLAASLALLRSWGFPEPLDYELHVPMVIEKAWMLETIERTLDQVPVVASAVKTLYGNRWGIGGEQIDDVKIRPARFTIPPGLSLVSTTDSSFKLGKVGEQLRRRFGEPSQYEAA